MNVTKKQLPNEDHAKYSASGSKRWISCPGSIALSAGMPDTENKYSTEGTLAHECLEKILGAYIDDIPSTKNFSNILYDSYTPEMIGNAEIALNWIMKRAERIGPDAVIHSERKVDASPFTCADQFGTLDCAIFEEFGELNIIDYKYGKGIPVDPDNNPQLIYYALAVCYEYDFNFSKVNLVIIQPRAEHEKGPIREWSISIKELKKWASVFKTSVVKCEKGCTDLNAGEWCRFCKGAPKCKAISTSALKSAKIAFSAVNPNPTLPVLGALDINQIESVLRNSYKLKTWIAEVERYAYALLHKGIKIPGFKLVEKRGTRKWLNYEKARRVAIKYFGSKCLSQPELLSPAQFEKIIKNKNFVKQFSTCVSSGMTLVKEDDERESINPIENVFDVVE